MPDNERERFSRSSREPTHKQILDAIQSVSDELALVDDRLEDHVETTSQWRDSMSDTLRSQAVRMEGLQSQLATRPKGALELVIDLLRERPWIVVVLGFVAVVMGYGGLQQFARSVGDIIRSFGG